MQQAYQHYCVFLWILCYKKMTTNITSKHKESLFTATAITIKYLIAETKQQRNNNNKRQNQFQHKNKLIKIPSIFDCVQMV
jgi:hypothetical protein